MTYLGLARKFRPQTFDDLIGQEALVRTLRNAIVKGRLAHAFLFSGIRGVGKTSAARILAKCLNCEQGIVQIPCNTCRLCREITEGKSVDVLEIDGASNRGIDEIRELRETVQVPPFAAKHRIYIIDEVHMLTREAFNALLKTLEEPPSHVFFIFATTEIHKVPVTILSRCQQFEFQRISLQSLMKRLSKIADSEGISIDKGALRLIAFQADGSMRDAESLLDQVISYSAEQVTVQEVAEIIGVVDRDLLFSLSSAVIEGDAPGVFELVEKLAESGFDLNQFLREFTEHFRNLLVYKVSEGSASLVTAGEEEMKILSDQSAGLSETDLIRLSNFLVKAGQEVKYASNPRFALELNLLKMVQAGRLVPIEELLKNAAGGSSGGGTGNVPSGSGGGRKSVPSSEGKRATEQTAIDPGLEEEDGEAPKLAITSLTPFQEMTEEEERQWSAEQKEQEGSIHDRILDALKKNKMSIYSMIKEASNLFSLKKDILTIGFSSSSGLYKEHVEKKNNINIIIKSAAEILGKKVRVKVVSHTPENADVKKMIDKSNEDFEHERLLKRAIEEPVVRAFMDTFHSEIFEVEKL